MERAETLDNITFVLNAVDELAGEEALLALRSRNNQLRTLTKLAESTDAFKKSQEKESAEADKNAKNAARYRGERPAGRRYDKIRDDKTLDRIDAIADARDRPAGQIP